MVPEDNSGAWNEVTPEDGSLLQPIQSFRLSQFEWGFLSFATEICSIVMDSPFLIQSLTLLN